MVFAGYLVFAAFLVWLMVRITRKQFLLEERLQERERMPVVGIDPESGVAKTAPPDDYEFMQENWHPVRFPNGWEGRSAGFPPERAHRDGDMDGRRAWCEKHCVDAWRVEAPNTPSPIFWFASRKDAHDFTLAWYPFKCT